MAYSGGSSHSHMLLICSYLSHVYFDKSVRLTWAEMSPQRFSAAEPLTTALISVPDTVELAMRICRILVIRLGKQRAVYVGCSVVVDGFGDRVREEVDVLGCVVEEVGRLVSRQ